MNALLITGMIIVVFALAAYTTAIITQTRRRRPTIVLRGFLTSGVALDATSTAFMIAGSRKIPFTIHGFLGYSAFLLMATDLVLIWRQCIRHGEEPLPVRLHRYSLISYSWWVVAFVVGIFIALRMT
jgi:hypothetical protein